ncbi:MerR family transcriptional regulator [Clostridium sp. D53t1_180928_C8]|uniref:MerR family transcriptional regulator n=1 Tax=Clostridium sp. D53t1_180928_C8 TaxID=2787101 RepID=UPI0018AC1CAF|nr:MerR family transcriptional regulator [Clostridium sp. D53t1_180928_C8]
MEYTVQKLSEIAKISKRTLRYYDEFGLLKPARVNSSGYRIYGEEEVNKLQQILFYRELGVSLEQIKLILENPLFDEIEALKEHRIKLLEKQKQIDLLLKNVNKTIQLKEGEVKMCDREKFEGFKKKIIDTNEKKYGYEIREKYGSESIEKSNKKFQNMTEEEYKDFVKLGNEVNEKLLKAFNTGNPKGELAQEVAAIHKKWLLYTWSSYTKEAHAGLAEMYVYDERFKEYYDKEQDGLAEFLRDSILFYTGIRK